MPHVRKGDEGEVDGVEHQLNRHEDGDDVALDEEGGDADGEEHGGEDQVGSRWEPSGCFPPVPPTTRIGRDQTAYTEPGEWSEERVVVMPEGEHSYCSFRASTTAPRMATRMRTEVTSKGSRSLRKRTG